MRSIKTTSIVLLTSLALVTVLSCSRSPEVAKQRYLESGNKYYDRAKYKEARIMYLDAIQKDRLFGPAYYHLGLASLKLQSLSEAVGAFRRAMDLIKDDHPEHWDAIVKLSEIYLLVGRGDPLLPALRALEGVTGASVQEQDGADHLSVILTDDAVLPRVLTTVERSGRALQGIQKREPSLEDAFVKLVGRSMAEEEGEA